MLPLAVALILAAAPLPLQAAPDWRGNAACRDIDPGFVIYVPPARQDGRNPLLWLVAGAQPRAAAEPRSGGEAGRPLWDQRLLDFRPAIKSAAPARPPLLCGRLVPIKRAR
jgi:hypothetical protein